MTLYGLAQRFVGELRELTGDSHDPFIQWCFTKCGYGPETPDETPWCSAFVNGVAWLARLPRSKSAAARSWLTVGIAIDTLRTAQVGDVVILKRGTNPMQGHVGFYAGGYDPTTGSFALLGGNQGNAVTVATFKEADVLGIRRLTV